MKCGAAFSILYEPIANSIYGELYSQFFRNHNIIIWEVSITCIMELLDYYGIEKFTSANETSAETDKNKRGARQLYNTLEFMDDDDEQVQTETFGEGIGIIYMMTHFLDTCEDSVVVQAIVKGFCCLILHDRINNYEILEKFLLLYFNPANGIII